MNRTMETLQEALEETVEQGGEFCSNCKETEMGG